MKVKRNRDGAVFVIGYHGNVSAEDPKHEETAKMIEEEHELQAIEEGLPSHGPHRQLIADKILTEGGGGTIEYDPPEANDIDLDVIY